MLTGSSNNFYEAKGVVDAILHGLGITDIWYDDYQATPEDSPLIIWHPKKTAEIKSGNTEIGFLGELNPNLLEKYDLHQPITIFDLNFDILQQLAEEEYIYQPVSKYPAAIRDISVLVPLQTKVVEVLNVINTAGGELVRDVDLFDIYEGQELPEGKKSLAFHIVYQAQDHTLTSQEIDAIHQKIIDALNKNIDWEVR